MKFLLVSDVHKSYKFFKGHDESVAVEWLLEVIDKVRPDVLISAGDWDDGMTAEDFVKISSKVKLLTIYGNHENFGIIRAYAMPDGKVFEIGDLKIAGINGLLGEESRKGVPMTSPIQFMNVINRLKNTVDRLDIFLAHQPPYIPEVYPKMKFDEYSQMMFDAVEDLKPRLFLNGHMTAGCYSYYEFPSGTKYLRVDSSQSYRCYALLEGDKEVTVYEDGEEVRRFTI
ncbi:metallophosphoesterase family protein [Stygiolobus caldivivus]|uniref:Calcineurin-like phosphoesterase domain-containing protein n=1 Tax=Stygiolobus caldivivus TaxID=2824673 RepID=A0A8D5U821_9CREN|nr:metallophosphoesterase [Stygiolobus caldivivus]BCU71500.1 hypothetical protein KN1_27970 [Stygiolobus caldivivus]